MTHTKACLKNGLCSKYSRFAPKGSTWFFRHALETCLKGCEYMDFLKQLIGIVAIFLCLSIAALIAWYCLFGNVRQEPRGTLVNQAWEVAL